MSDLFQHALSVFLGLFAVMNPIANTAVFVGLTNKEEQSAQMKIAFRAVTISFFIVVAFAILGKAIFHLFGITLPALRLAGGVLVFLIGYQMLHGESYWREWHQYYYPVDGSHFGSNRNSDANRRCF